MTLSNTDSMKVQDGRRRLWLPAAVLAAVSFAAAALTVAGAGNSSVAGPSTATVPAWTIESSSPMAAPVVGRPEKSSPTPLPAAGAPQRVHVESLGIDAPVLPIVTEGSTLDPPPDPRDLGWWADGAQPGAVRGSALITGHTVHDGGGALDDLETLAPGAEVGVRTARGLIRYVVESVVVLDKDTIARRAPQLFDQEVPGRLVLVTCEDWDGSGYRSNVVVTAVPTR